MFGMMLARIHSEANSLTAAITALVVLAILVLAGLLALLWNRRVQKRQQQAVIDATALLTTRLVDALRGFCPEELVQSMKEQLQSTIRDLVLLHIYAPQQLPLPAAYRLSEQLSDGLFSAVEDEQVELAPVMTFFCTELPRELASFLGLTTEVERSIIAGQMDKVVERVAVSHGLSI